MSNRTDREFVLDMFIACNRITKYIENISFEEFLKDYKTQDAVIRNIEILGEATKKVSSGLKEKYNNIEWKLIAKTRDKLIHDYFGVDLDVIWDISKQDIPDLMENLKKIIIEEKWELP
ncbi:HepT-like ribonuclease domain-containing protein [Persephonella sp.]